MIVSKVIERSSIKLISLDAADTLIRLYRSVGEQYADIASTFGVQVREEEIDPIFKHKFKQFSSKDCPVNHPKLSKKWWSSLVAEIYGHFEVRVSDFSPSFESFFERIYTLMSERNSWALYPDAEPMLETLQSMNYAMIVFSNFDSRLHKILEGLQIAGFFRKIYCSGELGLHKPDPRAYTKIAQLEGLEPGAILHIGDGLENDRIASQKAGFRSLWLRRGRESDSAKGEISSLSEIVDYLKN
ncbi:MAG: HAD-IA family hydrolase [Candidatus Caenarcaniphilales bacterium]|nr:HAD-IA family hydrolase [Candidatus Caenarcaniphilales bacterium]